MSDQVSLKEFIQRVEAYQIDDPEKSLSFLDRLARENNWTTDYAERVILEYKRFCILAIQAGHPVTPSEHVDQAWHLHLTYTRSYWQDFCEKALGQPLHHEPTAGGKAEGDKFRDWYAETLNSYRRLFNEDPPTDIWPSVNERFSHAGSWKWVNVGQSWVVPKRPVLVAASIAGSLAVVLFIAGCRPANLGVTLPNLLGWAVPPFSLDGAEFLGFYVVVSLIALLVMGVLGRRAASEIDSEMPNPKSESLHPYKVAVLSGGGARLLQSVLSELTVQGCIKPEKASFWRPPKIVATEQKPNSGAIADAVYNEIKASSSPKMFQAIQPYYEKYVAELTSMNLRYPSRLTSKAALAIGLLVLLLGGIRILQGFATDHSIGFLVVEMTLFTVISAFILFRSNMITEQGNRLIDKLREKHQPAAAGQAARVGSSSNAVLWAVALVGSSALAANAEFSLLKQTLDGVRNRSGSDTGGGCGAGCGGGGCGGGGCGGGGCGGCGGCGG